MKLLFTLISFERYGTILKITVGMQDIVCFILGGLAVFWMIGEDTRGMRLLYGGLALVKGRVLDTRAMGFCGGCY